MDTLLENLKDENDLSENALLAMKKWLNASSDLQPKLRQLVEQIRQLPGNAAQYGVNTTPTVSSSPLKGKQIAFLGSSVTWGFGALGESFVDYLAKKDEIVAIKEAVSGTTLVDKDVYSPHDSYVARLHQIDPAAKLDAFVLQLSTNDAKGTAGSLGQISNTDQYDVHTITGAIEFILHYVHQTCSVPTFVYTNPQYDNQLYGQMVDRLLALQPKWGFKIIDLYHDQTLPHGGSSLYMADKIHPTRAGYQQKWLPIFENNLMGL